MRYWFWNKKCLGIKKNQGFILLHPFSSNPWLGRFVWWSTDSRCSTFFKNGNYLILFFGMFWKTEIIYGRCWSFGFSIATPLIKLSRRSFFSCPWWSHVESMIAKKLSQIKDLLRRHTWRHCSSHVTLTPSFVTRQHWLRTNQSIVNRFAFFGLLLTATLVGG